MFHHIKKIKIEMGAIILFMSCFSLPKLKVYHSKSDKVQSNEYKLVSEELHPAK